MEYKTTVSYEIPVKLKEALRKAAFENNTTQTALVIKGISELEEVSRFLKESNNG